jgi:UDP-N-acetylglucosamine 2-epimerase (non-hydrolysing)
MSKLRPLIVLGTRPEAVKLAPVVHACAKCGAGVEPIVCLTGQHREMLRQTIEYFELPVHADLDLMSPNQTLAELTARCVRGIDSVLAEQRPHCVVVQGDTTTAMCAALAAFYHRLPVVHVEAGLRTGNLNAPWPEELNRRIVTLTTALNCAPTEKAARNLLAENVPPETVHVTGNTVIDALLWTVERERAKERDWRERHAVLNGQDVVLVTAHRRESFGAGLENVFAAVADLSQRFSNLAFVFPVHRNPQVRAAAHRRLEGRANVHLLEPLPYPEFVWMMDRCRLILSDSGGVQEEAPSLKKPVLVMRDTTERPEAYEAGAMELVGTCRQRIVETATRMLTDEAYYRAHQLERNPYGDGRSAGRIVELMLARGWHVDESSHVDEPLPDSSRLPRTHPGAAGREGAP